MLGGVFAILHLRTRDPRWDMRSYVAIHMSLIFGLGTLITGSIWAKGSWGHWWVWNEPTLVSFLIIFLLYATYQPLRFAIEDPERQSRYASVFAITAGVFVPLNYIAVNLATAYVHPRVSEHSEPPRIDGLHAARIPYRDGAPVRDAVQVRADREAHEGSRAARRLLEERPASGAAVPGRRTRSAVPSIYPGPAPGRMAGGSAS